MNKINVTYKGKVIGKGYLPELQTKPSHNYSYKITEYETTQNGVSDFDDQTDLFKKIFQKHETGINSKNKFVSTKSALDLIEKLEIVAGRKLNTTEQNNIVRQCKQATPRMKVNKYGRLFGKRQNTSIAKDSLTYKGVGNG